MGTWYDNYSQADDKGKFHAEIEKRGFPLEYRVRAIFRDHKFDCSIGRYESVDEETKNNVFREIDVYATREGGIKKIDNNNLRFKLTVIGECKFYSDQELLVFGVESDEDVSLVSIPIISTGAGLSTLSHGRVLETDKFSNIFDIDIIARNIQNIKARNIRNINSLKDKKRSKEKDGLELLSTTDASDTVYGKCDDQLVPALRYFLDEDESVAQFQYSNDFTSKFYDLENKIIASDAALEKRDSTAFDKIISLTAKEAASAIRVDLTCSFFVPILIVNNETSLLKVKFDDKGKVSGLEEIPYCVYLHQLKTRETGGLSGLREQAILVCKEQNLNELLTKINHGIEYLSGDMYTTARTDPSQLAEDLLRFFHGAIPYRHRSPNAGWD